MTEETSIGVIGDDDGTGRRLLRIAGRRQRGRGGEVLRLESRGADGGARPRGRPRAATAFGRHRPGELRARSDRARVRRGADAPQLAQRLGTARRRRSWPTRRAAALRRAGEADPRRGGTTRSWPGWNGLMIRGLAFAARVFERPEWAELGKTCGGLHARRQWQDGRLLRVYQDGRGQDRRLPRGLRRLRRGAGGAVPGHVRPTYLRWRQLADGARWRFWDPEQQAYLAAPRGQADLVLDAYSLHDNAFPSGASLLTEAQVALAALTGRPASSSARSLRPPDAAPRWRNPFGYGHLWCAADRALDGAPDVTLVAGRRRSLRSSGSLPGRTRRRSRSRPSRPERRRRSWRSSPTGRPRPGPRPRRTSAGTSPAPCRGSHRRRCGGVSRAGLLAPGPDQRVTTDD